MIFFLFATAQAFEKIEMKGTEFKRLSIKMKATMSMTAFTLTEKSVQFKSKFNRKKPKEKSASERDLNYTVSKMRF